MLKIGHSWCEFSAALFAMLLRQGFHIGAGWPKIAGFEPGARDGCPGTKHILGGALETPKIRSYAHLFLSLSPPPPQSSPLGGHGGCCLYFEPVALELLRARGSLPDGACADPAKAR